MIQKFVDRYFANKEKLEAIFAAKHPEKYRNIVEAVIGVISDEDDHYDPDPERIHEIDDGDYQGTLLFVIGAKGYQPSDYWFVKIYYGSCSGCDTLQGIWGYDGGPPSEEQIKEYMTLALHVVQGIKEMGGDAK